MQVSNNMSYLFNALYAVNGQLLEGVLQQKRPMIRWFLVPANTEL